MPYDLRGMRENHLEHYKVSKIVHVTDVFIYKKFEIDTSYVHGNVSKTLKL